MEYVFSNHLLEWLLLSFLAIKLLDLHDIFTFDILRLVLTLLKFTLSFLVVGDEIIDDTFQFLDGPPVLWLGHFLRIHTSGYLRLIDFVNELTDEAIKLLSLFSIHSLFHLTFIEFVRDVNVVPHAWQCLVNLLLAGNQLGVVLLIYLNVLRLIRLVVIIWVLSIICSFLRTCFAFSILIWALSWLLFAFVFFHFVQADKFLLFFVFKNLLFYFSGALRDQMTCVLFGECAHVSDDTFKEMEKVRQQILLIRENILSLIWEQLLAVLTQRWLIARLKLLAHFLWIEWLAGVRSLGSARNWHRWRRLMQLLKLPIEHLRSEIPAGLHIGTDSLYGFVHLNDLLENVVLLLFFNNSHNGTTVLNKVLLPLNFERPHLLQVI